MPAATESQPLSAGNERFLSAWLLALILAIPVIGGLAGVVLPALGWFPILGGDSLSLVPAQGFLATPGLDNAVMLALGIGLSASLLSLVGSFALLAAAAAVVPRGLLRRLMGPLIAVPHSTIAIGILFLLAPSGWLMRLASPLLTGLEQPAGWPLVPDPYGFSLVFGLLAKEIPFLVLVSIAAMAVMPVRQLRMVGASLGYGHAACWWLVILPLVYRRIRLPLMAVLIFSLSVVDMTLILGPSLPPPLAVLVVQGFEDADLAARLPASFGACLQLVLTVLAIGIWYVGERLIAILVHHIRYNGWRLPQLAAPTMLLAIAAVLPVLAGIFGLVAAGLWSLASGWFFPDALPAALSLQAWARAPVLLPALGNSLVVALLATLLSVVLVLFMLRGDGAGPHRSPLLLLAIFAPLLLPQVSFVLGLQMMLTYLRLDGSWLALVWMHALFILPYVWLVLAPASALDRRYAITAATLGIPPLRRYLLVTLPLLSPAIITALFIGLSVSVALYLPSLFAGAGRLPTITVEAVALASGGSRQITGVAAMLQILIPLTGFWLMHFWYQQRYGRFAGMQAGDHDS